MQCITWEPLNEWTGGTAVAYTQSQRDTGVEKLVLVDASTRS